MTIDFDEDETNALVWLLQFACERAGDNRDLKTAAFRMLCKIQGAHSAADGGGDDRGGDLSGVADGDPGRDLVAAHSAYRRGKVELWIAEDGTAQLECAGRAKLSLRDLHLWVQLIGHAALDVEALIHRRHAERPYVATYEGDYAGEGDELGEAAQ